jgi:hypothetical protein
MGLHTDGWQTKQLSTQSRLLLAYKTGYLSGNQNKIDEDKFDEVILYKRLGYRSLDIIMWCLFKWNPVGNCSGQCGEARRKYRHGRQGRASCRYTGRWTIESPRSWLHNWSWAFNASIELCHSVPVCWKLAILNHRTVSCWCVLRSHVITVRHKQRRERDSSEHPSHNIFQLLTYTDFN